MPAELLVAASDGAIEQQPPIKLVPIADYSAGASAPLVPARGADAVAISTFHPILHFIPFSIFSFTGSCVAARTWSPYIFFTCPTSIKP